MGDLDEYAKFAEGMEHLAEAAEIGEVRGADPTSKLAMLRNTGVRGGGTKWGNCTLWYKPPAKLS